jgi:hypothetical protein
MLQDEQNPPEIKPDDAIIRLSEALETCRSVIADYRATLIGNSSQLDRSLSAAPPSSADRQHP